MTVYGHLVAGHSLRKSKVRSSPSIEAEVRAPTAEEEANPWVVLGEMGRTADDDGMTAAGAARIATATL